MLIEVNLYQQKRFGYFCDGFAVVDSLFIITSVVCVNRNDLDQQKGLGYFCGGNAVVDSLSIVAPVVCVNRSYLGQQKRFGYFVVLLLLIPCLLSLPLFVGV